MMSKNAMFLIPVIAVFLAACAVSEGSPGATPSTIAITNTASVTNTASITNTASVTVIPASTYTPTSEPTKIPEATWTPLPTLSEEEAFILVDDLLKNNAGCHLPCFWGITPGLTTWDEASHFLASFVSRIRVGGEGYRPSSNGVLYAVKGQSYESSINFVISNDIITVIRAGSLSPEFIAQLHLLLLEYGLPEQIFIRTFDNSPGSYIRFTLVFYYQELRILASYEYKAQRIGEIVQACPSLEEGAGIMLWAEDVEFTLDEMEVEVFGSDPATHFRNLEDVTDYSYESFYEAFTDSTYSNCIETLAEHW